MSINKSQKEDMGTKSHITKRRYGEEKPERFVFEKPVLFTLSLGLTPWVFLSEISTRHFSLCLLSFG